MRKFLHLRGPIDLAESVELSKRAEASEFYGVSLPELIGQCPEDIFVRIGVISQNCKNLKIASNVVNPLTRHPVVLAMAAASCAKATAGNFVFGLGSGAGVSLGAMHIEDTHPLARLKESIEIIRRLLAGENLTYSGKYYSVSSIQLLPSKEAPPPILIAGIRDASVRFAALHGEGILMSFCSSEGYAKHVLKVVSQAKASKGFEAACNIMFIPQHDKADALKTARNIVARYVSNPGIGEILLEKSGFAPTIAAEVRRGRLERLSEEIVRSMVVVGGQAELAERLSTFERIGITIPIIGTEPQFNSDLISIAKSI